MSRLDEINDEIRKLEDEVAMLDAKQQALKILANSKLKSAA